jgi:aflatoxin B1 aldehyde reductase
MNELHKEGVYAEFGISNYMSWEVAELVYICKNNGWIQPTIYQGLYNGISRAVEPELFPCLRKFGIRFYAFNPLAGGFFTGRYTNKDAGVEKGGRFDPDRQQGKMYRQRYWNDTFFGALESLKPVAEAHKLTITEIALRWIVHHSLLKKEFGDKVIIGASSVEHIEENLKDFEKGPLPEEVVKAVDEAWEIVKPAQPKYWH